MPQDRDVSVHLLPELAPAERLHDGVADVIDVLRATTTIVTALHHGAAAVIPCGDIVTARKAAAELPAQNPFGWRASCLKCHDVGVHRRGPPSDDC